MKITQLVKKLKTLTKTELDLRLIMPKMVFPWEMELHIAKRQFPSDLVMKQAS